MDSNILAPQPIRLKQSVLCFQDGGDDNYFVEENPTFTSGSIDFEKSSSVTSFSPFNFFNADQKSFFTTTNEPISRSNIEKSKSLSSLSEEFHSQSLLRLKRLGPLRLNLAFCNRVKP
jgi:hypothetical protein